MTGINYTPGEDDSRNSDADHIGEVQPRPQQELDFELPAKACDIGRPEGCESCQ